MPDVGDLYRFGNWSEGVNQDSETSEAFTNINDVATDPTAVLLIVQKPDGSQLEYGWPDAGADGTLTREAAGRFYAEIMLDQGGKWQYRLEGTGVVIAASEASLRVERQRVIP